ncbi:MAG: hypothetical protein ABI838_03295 [Chloroflexota bacterium]
MEILKLPQGRTAGKQFDFRSLSDVLFESADLLEEARDSDDPEFKAAALDLAIRSLYTASTAIDRFVDRDRDRGRRPATAVAAAVVAGPWATETV